MHNIQLSKFQCIVVLDEADDAWIIARSEYIKEHDILKEFALLDNGADTLWSKYLPMGVYKLTIKPWSYTSYEGHYDCGIDIVEAVPLWEAE